MAEFESPGVQESYERENEKSWRIMMNKSLKNKVFAMLVMMLIVLLGGSSEANPMGFSESTILA